MLRTSSGEREKLLTGGADDAWRQIGPGDAPGKARLGGLHRGGLERRLRERHGDLLALPWCPRLRRLGRLPRARPRWRTQRRLWCQLRLGGGGEPWWGHWPGRRHRLGRAGHRLLRLRVLRLRVLRLRVLRLRVLRLRVLRRRLLGRLSGP